jgi:ethanolamine ammonia-lyase large subunit
VFTRTIIFVAVASALLTVCANSDKLGSNLGGPAAASEPERDASKQTLASKVLGAIALERVTERKADPARLYELH